MELHETSPYRLSLILTSRDAAPSIGALQLRVAVSGVSRSSRADQPFQKAVARGVNDVVRKQAEIGIDIPSDGEFSKPSFSSYVAERLDGLGDVAPGAQHFAYAKLTEEFPGFMAQYNAMYKTIWMPA